MSTIPTSSRRDVTATTGQRLADTRRDRCLARGRRHRRARGERGRQDTRLHLRSQVAGHGCPSCQAGQHARQRVSRVEGSDQADPLRRARRVGGLEGATHGQVLVHDAQGSKPSDRATGGRASRRLWLSRGHELGREHRARISDRQGRRRRMVAFAGASCADRERRIRHDGRRSRLVDGADATSYWVQEFGAVVSSDVRARGQRGHPRSLDAPATLPAVSTLACDGRALPLAGRETDRGRPHADSRRRGGERRKSDGGSRHERSMPNEARKTAVSLEAARIERVLHLAGTGVRRSAFRRDDLGRREHTREAAPRPRVQTVTSRRVRRAREDERTTEAGRKSRQRQAGETWA